MDGNVVKFLVILACCITVVFCAGFASNVIINHQRNSKNDPELACIEAKGNWGRRDYMAVYTCLFDQRP